MPIQSKKASNWQIWNMAVGLLGINFGWGLQMANMSAIYESLGATPSSIPILWLAAPLTGLLVQPIIGKMSDNTWNRLGRRKPYFLFGAIAASLALIFMPLCSSLWMAAGLLWVLDGSVNISMGPFRALVPDLLDKNQRTKGYLFQGIAIAIGTVVASALPWIFEHVFHVHGHAHNDIPRIVTLAFWVGAFVLLVAILWTVLTVKERPPVDSSVSKKSTSSGGFFKSMAVDIVKMPHNMRRLAWVMVFSWIGMFCLFLFFPITVATYIFHGHPGSVAYSQGLAWAGLCFSAYAVVFLIVSLLLPPLTYRFARKTVYGVYLAIGGLSLLSILIAHTKWDVLLIMIGVGIAFAGMQSLPYAILSDSLPKSKLGVYMGIFNLFIVIPEIIVALGFGYVVKHWLHDSSLLAVAVGGASMFLSAILTLRVWDGDRIPALSETTEC